MSADAPSPQPGSLLPAFAEIKPKLDSGDILLFGGESRFSRAIKRMTGGHWSHTALVARARDDGQIFLWEATLNTNIPDVVTGEIRAAFGSTISNTGYAITRVKPPFAGSMSNEPMACVQRDRVLQGSGGSALREKSTRTFACGL